MSRSISTTYFRGPLSYSDSSRAVDSLCRNYACTKYKLTWSRVYKTFFMLNSTEHEISTAHKN